MPDQSEDKVFTVNDIRESYGLEPIEDGDILLMDTPFGVFPAEDKDLYLKLFEETN